MTNDFDYEFPGVTFKRGFRGAFMNNVTAYGFMNLYRATGDSAYLEQAHRLLSSTASCSKGSGVFHKRDKNGFLWLNEYVFQIKDDQTDAAKAIGLQADGDGWYRARVYNGHIIALIPFIEYKRLTKSHEFDRVIQESIRTMDHYLPMQVYEGKYFSYMAHYRVWPDYGQLRAVLLAKGLCDVTKAPSLCKTATSMADFYGREIKGREPSVLKAGYAAGREALKENSPGAG